MSRLPLHGDNLVEIKGVFTGFQNKGYPGAFPPKVDEIIRRYAESPSLHLFSGTSDIGDVQVVLARPEATLNQDIFEFIKSDERLWKFVVADPPYEINQPSRHKIDKKYADFTPMNSTTAESTIYVPLQNSVRRMYLWFESNDSEA